MKPQTVSKINNEKDVLNIYNSLFETNLKVEILGQKPDRSYEDRDVFLEIEKDDVMIRDWLSGETAIELGQLLIKHGLYALNENMIQHQQIHHWSEWERYVREGRVESCTIENVKEDTKVSNYFILTPVWVQDKAPEYREDFSFEFDMQISPFQKEFLNQMENNILLPLDKIHFINFDWVKDIKEPFEEMVWDKSVGSPY